MYLPKEGLFMIFHRKSVLFATLFFISCLFLFDLFIGSPAVARSVSENEARQAVENWLEMKSTHMGENLGNKIEQVIAYKGDRSGAIGYYLAILDKGWIILPADDTFWPVQTFGAGQMTKELFESTLWYHATRFENTDQIATARGSTSEARQESQREIRTNNFAWHSLLAKREETINGGRGARDETLQGDIWVEPLLRNTNALYWGQGGPFNAQTTYHRLTGDTSVPDVEFPVGCGPLSKAQIIMYHNDQ